MHEAARHEESTDGGECGDWIGHVLDRVIERDDIEARGGKVEIFDPARGDAEATLARALRRVTRDLDTRDVPARVLRLDEEVAECATDVEQAALATVPRLDRADAVAEGAAVHVGAAEVVRLAALGV